jgi:hypothetical protein
MANNQKDFFRHWRNGEGQINVNDILQVVVVLTFNLLAEISPKTSPRHCSKLEVEDRIERRTRQMLRLDTIYEIRPLSSQLKTSNLEVSMTAIVYLWSFSGRVRHLETTCVDSDNEYVVFNATNSFNPFVPFPPVLQGIV